MVDDFSSEDVGCENFGAVNISDEVVSIIAALAARGISGINEMYASVGSGIVEFLGKKSVTRGVKVNVDGTDVVVDLSVIVNYGAVIPEVAFAVQQKVKSEVEKMTGLNVSSVNVHVEGIASPDGGFDTDFASCKSSDGSCSATTCDDDLESADSGDSVEINFQDEDDD